MIKKLGLLLCLGLAAPAPVSAASEDNKRSKQVREALIVGGFGLGVVGLGCLIAAFPESVGSFFGHILRALAEGPHCYHCGHRHHYHCHRTVTVTTYTTYR